MCLSFSGNSMSHANLDYFQALQLLDCSMKRMLQFRERRPLLWKLVGPLHFHQGVSKNFNQRRLGRRAQHNRTHIFMGCAIPERRWSQQFEPVAPREPWSATDSGHPDSNPRFQPKMDASLIDSRYSSGHADAFLFRRHLQGACMQRSGSSEVSRPSEAKDRPERRPRSELSFRMPRVPHALSL